MGANERKHMSAKERKKAQKGAKERKSAQKTTKKVQKCAKERFRVNFQTTRFETIRYGNFKFRKENTFSRTGSQIGHFLVGFAWAGFQY